LVDARHCAHRRRKVNLAVAGRWRRPRDTGPAALPSTCYPVGCLEPKPQEIATMAKDKKKDSKKDDKKKGGKKDGKKKGKK
jgi:hypothetical protein